MRLQLATLVLVALASVAASSMAAPSPTRASKSKVVRHDPLPSTKADGVLAGRALLVKDLPKSITATDRAQIDRAVTELRADHFEAGVGIFRAWANGSPKTMSRDDANLTALWVFREGVLSRTDDLATAADRLRFIDEQNAAMDDSIALVKGALITKKPVLVARLVVVTPYAREARGDEKRERQLARDALGEALKTMEKQSEEIKAQRDEVKAAFAPLDQKHALLLQTLTALSRTASELRLANGKT